MGFEEALSVVINVQPNSKGSGVINKRILDMEDIVSAVPCPISEDILQVYVELGLIEIEVGIYEVLGGSDCSKPGLHSHKLVIFGLH